MRRRLQEQQLRDAEPEQVVHADRLRARAHQPVEQNVDLAEPAQHGGHQQAGERPVAALKAGKGRVPGERLLERTPFAQHPVEHVQRDQARSPAGASSRAQAATDRAARRSAHGGSAPWFPPARRTPRTSRSAAPRSGRAGSRTAPGTRRAGRRRSRGACRSRRPPAGSPRRLRRAGPRRHRLGLEPVQPIGQLGERRAFVRPGSR